MTITDWTPELISRLRELWAGGESVSAIGRMLGCSKNAVVGKAHRLGLPARPSPIVREGAPRPYSRTRAVAPPVPVVRAPEPPALRPGLVQPCVWLEGRSGAWVRCGEPSVPGKPYCLTHYRRAYVSPGKPASAP